MAYTTINKSTDYFNTKLYTGNGSVRTETGVGFQPDFTWIKDRTGTNAHVWTDAVRGANYQLYSNLTNAQTNASGYLTAFASDGFTLGTDGAVNQNSSNYVSWNWKAGNSAGSSNGDGSVTSTVTANTTAGFSIVKWTGTGATATVGHGLGVKPSIVLIKNTGAVENWVMYHSALTAEKNLKLNNQEAAQDTTGAFNDTEPTSSVFTVHTNTNTNQNGQVMIAYCFAQKTGYSKFGKYEGNGNSDGPFIYTGFRPAWVMIKRYSGAGNNWLVLDNKRDPSNQMGKGLLPDVNNAEATGYNADFLSNGFKLRLSGSGENGNNFGYIYWAFGQSLVGSNNIPCTAR